jgi:membrane protein YqaA with SNARE-associated domain
MMELAGLFVVAFLSATLLPSSSEAALAAVMTLGTAPVALAVATATAGNTMGSLLNWLLGAFFAHYRDRRWFPVKPADFDKVCGWYRKWGVWTLALSWVPLLGDPLTIVAGVMRTPLWIFIPVVALAKGARYLAVAGAISLVW